MSSLLGPTSALSYFVLAAYLNTVTAVKRRFGDLKRDHVAEREQVLHSDEKYVIHQSGLEHLYVVARVPPLSGFKIGRRSAAITKIEKVFYYRQDIFAFCSLC